MARYQPLPESEPFDDGNDGNDGNDDKTFSFWNPTSSSTPAAHREEMEMKRIHEKSVRPETSYAESSFGGTDDLELRLAKLRRDHITGLLNTEGIPDVENPLSAVERGREIGRVRNFIKKRYPNADFSKLVISFSTK